MELFLFHFKYIFFFFFLVAYLIIHSYLEAHLNYRCSSMTTPPLQVLCFFLSNDNMSPLSQLPKMYDAIYERWSECKDSINNILDRNLENPFLLFEDKVTYADYILFAFTHKLLQIDPDALKYSSECIMVMVPPFLGNLYL